MPRFGSIIWMYMCFIQAHFIKHPALEASMIRHYFISDDLDDLNAVEQELLEAGIDPAQLRVLSDHNQSNAHKVDEVDSLSRRDIIHSGLVGGVIGLGVAAIIIGVGYYSGASSLETWLPFIFLSIFVACFCTWEGGLFGIQVSNVQFRRFESLVQQGYHVLLIDMKKVQDENIRQIVEKHPKLQDAGTGQGRPDWVVSSHKNMSAFIKAMP